MSDSTKFGTFLRQMADKVDGVSLTAKEQEQVHDVNLVESLLEDGQTTVMTPAESWAAGVEVFAVVDGENVPLPVGEYPLQDGSLISFTLIGFTSLLLNDTLNAPSPLIA